MDNADPKNIGIRKAPKQVDSNSPYLRDLDQRNWSELSTKYKGGKVADLELEAKAVKLAKAIPALRPHLIPLIKQARKARREDQANMRLAAAAYPKTITNARWASMTVIEKVAVLRRVAHKPVMLSMGLTKAAVRDGMAFMTYKIDAGANNSKFYEGLVVEDPSEGGYRIVRRWGALTDSGGTGRVEGVKYDEDPKFWFPNEALAKRELQKHYRTRLAHGYKDAFGLEHQTPDGHKLPMGEYPVGLTRANPGFGWGSQSVTNCIPSLRGVQDALSQARAEIAASGRSEVIKDQLDDAIQSLRTVAHADSTMAQKILGFFSKSYRRLSGSPRFLPDPDGRALSAELATAQRYISKQLSLCE